MKFTSLLFALFFVSCSISHAASLTIGSNDLSNKGDIPNKHVFNGFGCVGKNISPQINWKNAPQETKSFALTVYDPDAPTGSGWWHWMLVNIPVKYNQLPANFGEKNMFSLKDGIAQIRNDFGTFSFGGPCPPQGNKPHRYIFTIYALRAEKLDLQEGATAAFAGFMINQNVLAKASFEAYFGR